MIAFDETRFARKAYSQRGYNSAYSFNSSNVVIMNASFGLNELAKL